MQSTVFYRLFRMNNGELLWLFCEWDQLLPRSMTGHAWGKPVYLAPVTPFAPYLQSRRVNDHTWVDLKWLRLENGRMAINYDKDIVRMLIEDFGVDPVRTTPIFPGIVGVSADRLEREVGSHSNPLAHKYSAVQSELSALLHIHRNRIGMAGSQVIGLQDDESSDLDIVVNMPLSRMSEFANTVWDLKRRARHLQRDKLGMHFPYKIFLKGCAATPFGIDLFPKALDLQAHFLTGAQEWTICSTEQRKEFHVQDTSLAHEGWPILLCNDQWPLVILCNGFRGVFAQGDVVKAKCVQAIVSHREHSVNVWIIDDPFRDIEGAESYFKFQRGEPS